VGIARRGQRVGIDPVTTDIVLADSNEVGALGVLHLKRLWSRAQLLRRGRAHAAGEPQLDRLVINALGLGVEQTWQYLLRVGPTFAEFEQWIVATAGEVVPATVARINAAVRGEVPPEEARRKLAEIDAASPVLTASDLEHWIEHGFVIVRGAASVDQCVAAEQAVWDDLRADRGEPATWYVPTTHEITLELIQHPAISVIRHAPRIHKSFAQLWQTADLWPATGRVEFSPPDQSGWPTSGRVLHWDVSLQQPIPFGTQGILHLTDTPVEQGAFMTVPGFHRRVHEWLSSLRPGTDPRQLDLHSLGAKSIAAGAGDLIIWHQALPHGVNPNRGVRPRMVQYINYQPARYEEREVWI
jgi:hypothetical protein